MAIGIDFGTSNSTIGIVSGGQPSLLSIEEDKKTIPSAIFYHTNGGPILFGRQAVSAYLDREEGRFMRALKSVLGSSLIEETTLVGKKRLPFKAIISHFLSNLKERAEEQVGGEVTDVVLGRPVFFVDDNPEADVRAQAQLEEAAKTAGFKNISFQFEPIAAALDYEQSVEHEEIALIADIGGGTSDFSLVRVSPERRGQQDRRGDILANTGTHVGGTNLDYYISIQQFMPLLGFRTRMRQRPELDVPSSPYFDLATWHRIPSLYTRKAINALKEMRFMAEQPQLIDRLIRVVSNYEGHRLASDAEKAKIDLSVSMIAQINLDYVESGLKAEISRAVFEETTKRETDKISTSIAECFKQAGIRPEEVNTLFITGGTTSVPSVLAACCVHTPQARIVEGDKFGSVGLGLGLDAKSKFK